MQCNIPNMLTWLRILMIPLFIGLFYLPLGGLSFETKNMYAVVIFACAAFTDWLDGYLARAMHQTSVFGAFLDPVADKLMVCTALLILVELGRAHVLVVLIIVGREVTISALREWMAVLGKGKHIAVAFIGKLKTGLQMIAILFLLYWQPIGDLPTSIVGTILLDIAAALTLFSMGYYLKKSVVEFKQSPG